MSEIALAALVSLLLICTLHWFPWRLLLHRELHRTEAYIMGMLAILAPAGVVLWLTGNVYALIVVGACVVAAGVTTIAAKAIDLAAAHRNELHDRRARD